MSESRFELPGFIKKPLEVAKGLAEQGRKILGIPERMVKKHAMSALGILFFGAVLGAGIFMMDEGNFELDLKKLLSLEFDDLLKFPKGPKEIAQAFAGTTFVGFSLGHMLHGWSSSYTAKLKAQKAK